MSAFNFTVNIEKVEDGTKLSTIRKTQRCKVGDDVQLYAGQRTKACRKLRDSVCVGTAKIEISDEIPWFLSFVDGDVNPTKKPLHEQEGFRNAADFVDFFRQHYGLPFVGWLHAWR
jgi:hypothetical protein